MTRSKKPHTLLTHAGASPADFHGAVNVPPHRMSTVAFPTYAEFEKAPGNPLSYGRAGTPSTRAFEEIIAGLEGAHDSVATCSGLSAVTAALLAFAQAGDHVLMTDNCYGPGRRTAEQVLRRFGVDVEYFPAMTGAEIAGRFRPRTKLVFMEAPGSLTFEVQDIGAIAAAAKNAGIRTALDNSWATPLFLRPLELGIDVSVIAATKYVSGHSDAMLGVISANAESWPAIKKSALLLGLCPGSEEIYLGTRGLRTLHVRLAQHQAAGLDVARMLESHPAVKRVLHPALPSCPGHENWKRYFGGSSGTFGIVLKETRREKIAAMLDGMELFRMGFSWGGFESLLFPEQPHPIRTAEKWAEEGFSLRLHIGLEDVADLKADLEAGLERLGHG